VLSRYFFDKRDKCHTRGHWLHLFIVMIFASLGACHSLPIPSIIRDNPILPQQVALGDAKIITLEKRLTKKGVQIISVGQDYLLSIAMASLFGDQSPQLTWKSYDELNEVACYLRQFRKVGVEITGYTSRYVSTEREFALSAARAEAVAHYLWSQGVETRLLFSRGVGNDQPLVMGARASDQSPNARIEITFRRAIV
jgi:intracellular multiplication protein IcmN